MEVTVVAKKLEYSFNPDTHTQTVPLDFRLRIDGLYNPYIYYKTFILLHAAVYHFLVL